MCLAGLRGGYPSPLDLPFVAECNRQTMSATVSTAGTAWDVPPRADHRYGFLGGEQMHFDATRISAFRHDFHEHPLLKLSRLRELAVTLMPSRQCRFLRPETRQDSEFVHASRPHDGRGLQDVFDRIEEPGSWIALYNVETQPEYAAFLADVIDAAGPALAQQQPGIFNIGGFVFISAPPSVTPFHIDRENNFWLQVSGRKIMSVWDHRDREVVAARDVEEFIVCRSLQRVRLHDDHVARARHFDVGPGDGVYFPSTSPHATRTTTEWVHQGDGVSISIGVVFYSDVTRRHARVHQCNRVLRRVGFDPTPPGSSRWLDRIKSPLGMAVAMASRRLRGYEPPPGAC